jgi:hypothetical protein
MLFAATDPRVKRLIKNVTPTTFERKNAKRLHLHHLKRERERWRLTYDRKLVARRVASKVEFAASRNARRRVTKHFSEYFFLEKAFYAKWRT